MEFPFDVYEKYVKPTMVKISPDQTEPDKLFTVEDETPAEAPQVVIPEDMKAALMEELRSQIMKELEVNKSKEEEEE